MATARNGEVELWYDVQGEGDAVVLSGGFGLLDAQFERVTPYLAERMQVVNWNWRGAGRSDRALAEPPSVERWTDDLRAVLDALGIERCALWGTSTGAFVSIHFAARYPERVSALVTYPQHKTPLGFRKAYDLFVDVFETFGWDAFIRIVTWIGLPEERLDSEEGLAFARWERAAIEARVSPEAMRQVCAAARDCDLTSDLARLAGIPILTVAGDSGPLGVESPGIKELASEFATLAPHAETYVVKGTGGTYCVLERPEESARAVLDWLARVS